jgi:hypothetical protein
VKWLIRKVICGYVDALVASRNQRYADDRKWSNCLIEAFQRQQREGGYVVIQASVSHESVPHAVWAKEIPVIEVESFDPGAGRLYGWRVLLDAIVFRGTWKKEVIGSVTTTTSTSPHKWKYSTWPRS